MLQKLYKQRRLQVLTDRIEGVADRDRRYCGTHIERDRLCQDVTGQMPDLFGHGGREEQGLPLLREMLQDSPDVREKTHVEHMVGLVKDQYLKSAEINRPLTKVVEEPSRAGNDNLCAASQLIYLGINTYAAIDGYASEAGLPPQAVDRLMYLLCQFACGCDDKGTNISAASHHQAIQYREHKGSGLAGAGLCQAHDVAP
jgi:hypothetical protein